MAIIILRSEAAPAGSPFTVPVASDTLPPKDMTVEFGRGNERDLTDVRLQDGVIDAAPAMPLQLIKPLAVSDAAPGAYPPVSWGVQAVGAATCELTGTGITVAILDTGIDKDYEKHPAFEGVKIERKNFTTDPDHDVCGHGTHCAGTVFGRAVDGCRIGVAPCVERALIGKVLGEEGASTDKLVEAILWAFSEGAHVISLSLGMDFPGYRESLKKLYPDELATLATSMALEGYRANVRVFDRLSHFLLDRDRPDGKGSGAVIVAAAGNESKR
jgi:subtilisin family serine protease